MSPQPLFRNLLTPGERRRIIKARVAKRASGRDGDEFHGHCGARQHYLVGRPALCNLAQVMMVTVEAACRERPPVAAKASCFDFLVVA